MTVTVTVSSGQTYTLSAGEIDSGDIVDAGGTLNVATSGTVSGRVPAPGAITSAIATAATGLLCRLIGWSPVAILNR